MESLQLIGLVVGAGVGLLIGVIWANSKYGGQYRHVGGGWFEQLRPGSGGARGCLLELFMILVGAGAGYLVGTLLLGG